MKRLVLVALLASTIAVPAHAQVRVGIDIGIQLPAPPALVVIPESPVYYAPSAPANVFFYAHQYWAFAKGGWYVGPSWSGPWVVVEPAYVPVPVLRVPVRYYAAPRRVGRGGVVKRRRSGAHPTDVSGTRRRTSATGVSVRSSGIGTAARDARRDSPSRAAAESTGKSDSPGCVRRVENGRHVPIDGRQLLTLMP